MGEIDLLVLRWDGGMNALSTIALTSIGRKRQRTETFDLGFLARLLSQTLPNLASLKLYSERTANP